MSNKQRVLVCMCVLLQHLSGHLYTLSQDAVQGTRFASSNMRTLVVCLVVNTMFWHTDTQTETHRQTHRQTDTQTDTQTHTHTPLQLYTHHAQASGKNIGQCLTACGAVGMHLATSPEHTHWCNDTLLYTLAQGFCLCMHQGPSSTAHQQFCLQHFLFVIQEVQQVWRCSSKSKT